MESAVLTQSIIKTFLVSINKRDWRDEFESWYQHHSFEQCNCFYNCVCFTDLLICLFPLGEKQDIQLMPLQPFFKMNIYSYRNNLRKTEMSSLCSFLIKILSSILFFTARRAKIKDYIPNSLANFKTYQFSCVIWV